MTLDLAKYPVLIVDDEQDNLDAFRFNFKRSFTILVAGGGPEALEILRAKKNIRLLVVPNAPSGSVETRTISGGLLMQATDRFQAAGDAPENWTPRTAQAGPDGQIHGWEYLTYAPGGGKVTMMVQIPDFFGQNGRPACIVTGPSSWLKKAIGCSTLSA